MNNVGAGVIFLVGLFMISWGLVLVGLVLSKKMRFNREKMSTFECGFEPLSSARQAFCLRFFLLAIIFVVFDVEMALLIPYMLTIGEFMASSTRVYVFIFVGVLLVGLLHEYNEGSLDWAV
uniref:NADH-ubiquinone oxidoreductase chain 3 n=1 Tax=Nuttallia olivacea TaxID=1125678 RepID=I6NHT4_9BIVA|nr:NADH dehydrogenase subunit 3 [Nuttallia olivacea]AEV94293.1 NADH dehydrogenase subunit 3 [Nuttallia olivacea]